MHKPEFIRVIEKSSARLNIKVEHFAENWAMRLSKDGIAHYVIGCTVPLNNAVAYKIARNKNICSDVLMMENVPHIPHQLIFNPWVLKVRKKTEGMTGMLREMAALYEFPLLIKRNHSSKGDGVFLIPNQTELEYRLLEIFHQDNVACIVPFRKILNEYRLVILDGVCLLCYEKIRPFIEGNGKDTIFDLIKQFYNNLSDGIPHADVVASLILDGPGRIAGDQERIYLQWKHNTSYGSSCVLINDSELEEIGVQAAKAINARFVAVDIARSDKFGCEVLEVNASVVLNLFSSRSEDFHEIAIGVFEIALRKLFSTDGEAE